MDCYGKLGWLAVCALHVDLGVDEDPAFLSPWILRYHPMNPAIADEPRQNVVRKNWDEMAAWYDEKQGDEGDLWHRTLIDPVLCKWLAASQGYEY
jgi:hypothetical protein